MEKNLTYEMAIKRLEQIVAKIENGEMDVDALAFSIKEAKDLAEFCKEKLTKVENEV
ncbi:MAG: exodeoxyribonuclease VII small subunit, partial [Bacteroidaceae bacterium]|nr:exodeoxyribonuclease VII small subunit [Bacteroidaceae bacterium]